MCFCLVKFFLYFMFLFLELVLQPLIFIMVC
uniref:Uncharacterized protein n=2 Tax=Anguilla anguilla TaxID=7936 RepID=A0A0E9SEN3_ANGAN